MLLNGSLCVRIASLICISCEQSRWLLLVLLHNQHPAVLARWWHCRLSVSEHRWWVLTAALVLQFAFPDGFLEHLQMWLGVIGSQLDSTCKTLMLRWLLVCYKKGTTIIIWVNLTWGAFVVVVLVSEVRLEHALFGPCWIQTSLLLGLLLVPVSRLPLVWIQIVEVETACVYSLLLRCTIQSQLSWQSMTTCRLRWLVAFHIWLIWDSHLLRTFAAILIFIIVRSLSFYLFTIKRSLFESLLGWPLICKEGQNWRFLPKIDTCLACWQDSWVELPLFIVKGDLSLLGLHLILGLDKCIGVPRIGLYQFVH